MPVRSANAQWSGTIREGKGHLRAESGVLDAPYSFRMRFENEPGTNPEELIAAAHAGCYSMQLSAFLGNNNTPAELLDCTAKVHLNEGTITKIELNLNAKVPGISPEKFAELAAEAKAKCPVSKALAAVPEIVLNAQLV